MERIKKLLFNNVFLAFVLSIPFDAAILMSVSKFRIAEIASWELPEKVLVYYYDLDKDGFSERVHFEKNVLGNACVKIFNPAHLGQFNSNTSALTEASTNQFGDMNNDGVSEILFLGEKDSAVYLNILDYRTEEIKEYFIDYVPAVGTTDYYALIHVVKDFDLDGFHDVLVSVSSGFSLVPRALYLIKPHKEERLVTPFQGSILQNNQVLNIDGDPYPEILVNTFAYRNQIKPVPNTDSCTWLIVYDHNLQYEFDPVRISCNKSQFSAIPLISKGKTLIAGVCNIIDSEEVPNRLFLFSGNGEKLLDLPFEKGDPADQFRVRIFPDKDQKGLFFHRPDGSLFRIDIDLKLKLFKKRKFLANYSANLMDLNNDGLPEWIFMKNSSLRWVVTDQNFNHPVKWNMIGNPGASLYSHKLNGNKKPTFFIQSGTKATEIYYGINPWWYGQIGWYAVVWGFFILLITLISHIQSAKLRQQALLQEQMNELQYRVITSQFSPHYTFNVLNAISAKLYGTYPELYDYINRFSRQLRYLYAGRNELERTLKEELDFCRDYLEIQKLRFIGKFGYEVHISEEVSQETIIPKMLVFTFVENALKHGLRAMESGGYISITVEKGEGNVLLKITDNGIGRKAAVEYLKENPQYSTGKGLELLEKLVQQLNQTSNVKISWEISDRKGKRGTEVIVMVTV